MATETENLPPRTWLQKTTSHTRGYELLTKKEIAVATGIMHQDGRYSSARLYEKVPTPQVLAYAGVSEQEVRKVSFRTFDAVTSCRLRAILGI